MDLPRLILGRSPAIFAVLLLTLLTCPAQGQTRLQGDDLYFLDESVVTPSRREEPLWSAPSTVVVVSHQAIAERGYRDLVDVLEDLPGFDIQRRIGGQDGGSYVIGRGLWGNNKVQVLMDGVPINPQNGTHLVYGGHLSVDGLDRIEVMYGPSSAIYGADAFAAVINLITQEPRGKGLTGEGSLQGGKDDTVLGHLLVQHPIGENGSFHLYFHGYRTNGFDMRREYQEHTIDNGFGVRTPIYAPDLPYDTPEQDYDMRLRLRLGGWEMMLMSWYTRQPNNIQTPYYTGRSQMAKDKAELRTIDGVIRNEASLFPNLSLTSELFWQFYELDPTSDYGRLTFDNYIYERSRSLRWEERGQYRWHEDSLTAGFMVQRVSAFPYVNTREPFDRGDRLDKCLVEAIGFPSGEFKEGLSRKEQDYWNYGLYAELDHWFTSDLDLRVGLRYDWTTLTHTNSFNPRISLIYRMGANRRLRLSYGTAYIAPSLYYLQKAWAGRSIVHVPPELLGEDLESEKLQSVELAYSALHGPFSLDASIYYSQARDLIVESSGRAPGFSLILPDGSINRNIVAEYPKNMGTQDIFGVDFLGKWRLSSLWSVYLYYSYIYDRMRLQGKEFAMPKVSDHKIGGGITGLLWNNLTCHLQFRWWSGIHTARTNPVYQGRKLKGGLVFDASLRWTNVGRVGLDLVVTAENLLNTEYFTAGSQSEDPRFGASLPKIPQEPRRLLAGIEYHF